MAGESSVIHIPSTVTPLPADWGWMRLDEACDGVFDCPHSTPVLTADGPLVVRSQDMRTGMFRVEEAAHVSEEIYQERIVRAEPRYGDLLYSREGTYFGIAAEVPAGVRVCLGQRMVLLRPKASKCNHRFLRYWLNSPVMASHTHGHRDGTVAERLNLPTIRQLPVAVPPLDAQRTIAHMLGTLDDKIELNRCMNETLEAIATAIFKSWFVDFGPVRAKASGEQPESICRRLGLTPDLLALFPDHLQDSELGEIPEGWAICPVGEVVHVVGGSTPSTKTPEYWEGGSFYWATPKDLSSLAAPVLIETDRKITELGLKQISSGLLPAGTLLMSSRAPIGYLAISDVPVAVNQGFIAILCQGQVSPYYMLNWCHFNMDLIKQRAGGTTFAEISKSSFRPIPFVVPNASVLRSFSNIVKALYGLIAKHCRESKSLGDIRDALLPKLISGELRVPSEEE